MHQLTSTKVRQTFLDFFKSKGHHIVPSAPMVVKNDPTLMFNNSGMAPFKDLFLGNAPIKFPRVADTQKCLRVSGKHNDLEEVGVDTYHHTMFEMLGNWSFGDYFKKDAINWAWELLTEVYKIDKSRLYVTVFEGSADDGLGFDQEAYDLWKQFVPEDRILRGNKKDNFWEMGDMGPCGPCSEIHYDGRTDEERAKISGAERVNNDDPQVIEVWNNVFMEFNRKADGSLEKLPAQHVDTGMGFERLVRVLQQKQSNYDSDVFTPLLNKIEELAGLKYKSENENAETTKEQLTINIAMRVIADHIRAISFSIADGQLPSNTGAGYVIRRILRRAIRYGYQSLNLKEPFMYQLVNVLANQMGEAFPELISQRSLIEKVIKEEETSFFRTLENGLKRIENVCTSLIKENKKIIDGSTVFELYDTFGFPLDLTSLIARDNGLSIDEKGFQIELEKQKDRSRAATAIDTGDWVEVESSKSKIKNEEPEFVGYKQLECESKIIQYRKVKAKGKEQFQIVLDKTPFYAESGGQVGDRGTLESANEKIIISDTKKENGIIIHFADKLPENFTHTFIAKVDLEKRQLTENNHSATHLLHAALRKVLGTHVEQKGSLVNEEHLRFDFSHFSKVTDEEIAEIEAIVNHKIRENISTNITEMPIDDARKAGAMALFGEKYGDVVRVVKFPVRTTDGIQSGGDKNYSIELCGGTHVPATGQIGLFKITSEGAVAAGIRRIEAITSVKSEAFFNQQSNLVNEVKALLKNPKDVLKSLQNLLEDNSALQKQIEQMLREKAKGLKIELLAKKQIVNGINFIAEKIDLDSADAIKDLSFELRNQIDNLFMVLAAEVKGKPSLSIIISDNLVADKKLNAGTIVRELGKEIQGGGGGAAFYATAGGTNSQGISKALEKAKSYLN
ncbi:MAG: alanine--tRNA ligase [Bacteroidetes bacterium RIFCSPLOWO2_12_FULL_35_15]|nr:MAG: alanine--tRNA ligase [Bacteroidetes bacterium RIFCSPLOWO2_12_FULL_35_15]